MKYQCAALLCLSVGFLLQGSAQEMNWPEFRGARADGATTNAGLPLQWSESQNIRWKTPIHGRGWSSPVILEGQVWVTTATEDGKELFAVCLDRDTGKVLVDQKLFDVAKPQYCHPFNTYASPTPAVEPGRVYVSFGSPGTACVDTQTGKVIWERRDFECNHYRGAGSSPILYGDLLFLNFDGSDHQFVVALDKKTGRTVWRKERSIDFQDLDIDGKPQTEGDLRKAFATCLVADLGGRPTLLSQGSKALYAYDPLTGKEWWRVEERSNYSGSTRPVIGHGLVFVPSGFASGILLAIRPGKEGEVLDAKANAGADQQLAIAWKSKTSVPKKPSLILVGDLLYAIEDNGAATCREALTGNLLWTERLGGHFSASPLAAPGRIYYFSEEGKTTVLAQGREARKLAESQLGDGFMASPAVSGRGLFLRSRTALYRVEE